MSSDQRRRNLMRLRQGLVLLVLAGGLVAYFHFDLSELFSFDYMAQRSHEARELVAEQPVQVVAVFMVVLTLVTLFCIPAVAVMQAFSGFLFGPILGTLLSVLAQTAGGALAFLIARSTFRESFARLIGPYVGRLEAGFRANAFTYIVTLRMTPVMPYWVVNIAPSLLGVRFRPFVLGTLFGAIPLTFVYAAFGAGLGEVIEAGGTPALRDLLTPKAIALLAAMFAFALLPLLIRRWLGRRVNPRPAPMPPPADDAQPRDRAPRH